MKQDRLKNWEPFPIAPTEIDHVLLTHAHLDHSGYLPRFIKQEFTGKVHCTWSTSDLCAIMLRDSGHLQEEDRTGPIKKVFKTRARTSFVYREGC